MAHTLAVLADRRKPDVDRAQLWLRCPDCDLTIHVTIGPASAAGRLIADLTAAHQQQKGAL